MKRNAKLYSCGEAAPLTGLTRDCLQRRCRARKLGKKVQIPGTDSYRFLISEKEIEALKAEKTQGKRRS